MTIHTCRPSALSEANRAHLRHARAYRAGCRTGVYLPGETYWPWVMLAAGAAALAQAGWMSRPSLQPHEYEPGWQATVFALGAMLAFAGAVALRRRRGEHFLGNFHLLDALQFWSVSEWRVEAIELGDFRSVRCVHGIGERTGNYKDSSVMAGETSLTIKGQALAERCAGFLRAVLWLRHESDPSLQAQVADDARLTGYLALELDRGGGGVDLERVAAQPDVTPFATSGKSGLPFWVWLAVVTVAAAAVGGFVLPQVRDVLRDERLYASTMEPGSGLRDLERYLREFPHGRHADTAGQRRDELRDAKKR